MRTSIKLIYTLCYFSILVLCTTEALAQTFPPATSCTSKDLELISATLPPPGSNPCQCDGTRQLVLGIRNKTGSTRTAFALWGTLKRYDASGGLISSTPIFACAGPIKSNSDNFLPATSGTTTITISCGQSLEIVDLYLAWTSANNNENCDFLSKNSATINPKCGTLPSIKVGLGVAADFVVTNATCSANGSIKVSPNGGVAPYKVKIGTDERTNIAASGSTTFSLPAGTYSILITDSRGCTNTQSRTIGSSSIPSVSGIGGSFTKTCTQNTSGATIGETPVSGFSYSWSPSTGLSNSNIGNPTANPNTTTTYTVTKTDNSTGCSNTAQVTVMVNTTPPTFTVCMVQPTLCANSGSVTINASGGSGFQYSIDNGAHFQSGNSFTGLASGSVTGIIVTNSFGCASNTAPCDVVSDCSGNVTLRQSNSTSEMIVTNEIAAKAYPNPFNDKVKFVVNSPNAGNGSLEVYNLLGQKIKTIYQGHITSGNQSFELTIPKKQQATLIYIFRVGNKQVTGKLLQLNN